VNMWHLALHWDGLMSHGWLDWIVHAEVTARRLVDFEAYIPRVTIETVNI
jgi:hypothetical protein